MQRSIKSAERTLELLELFARRQEPLTVGAIARALDIPQPSTSILLSRLAELGYLDYDRGARMYAPSIRVVLLGSWIGHRFGEAASMCNELHALSDRLDVTTFLGVQNGAHAQYVMVQKGERADRWNIASGEMRTLTACTTGRVLLALKSDAEIVPWVRRCNAEATSDGYRVQESVFLRIIGEVRRMGYAQTLGEFHADKIAFAMHVPSPLGGPPLAIGCVGLKDVMDTDREMYLDGLRAFQNAFQVEAGSRAA